MTRNEFCMVRAFAFLTLFAIRDGSPGSPAVPTYAFRQRRGANIARVRPPVAYRAETFARERAEYSHHSP